MARFFGSVQGQRGEAHRLGHTSITTTAASWGGAIEVELTAGPNGKTQAIVRLIPWKGSKTPHRILWNGIIEDQQEA